MTQKSSLGVAIPATPLSRHGLVTNSQLRASGLSQSAIWYRVKRGALFRRYHGVYSLSPGELSREGEWTAALLAAGEGATLSDLSAAILSRAWRYPEDGIDITLAAPPRADPRSPTASAPARPPGRLRPRRHPGHDRGSHVRRLQRHADARGTDERHPRGGLPQSLRPQGDAASDGTRERAGANSPC